jgi:hypothetical protein
MQVSQENGNTTGTVDNYYPVDQWQISRVSSSTINVVRQSTTTPWVQIYATPADTAAAAGEYVAFQTKIEGNRLSDFLLGSALSKQFIVAFDVQIPVAGTYWVSFATAGGTYSYLGSYTISAGELNAFARKSIVVPAGAINAGTWPVDTSVSAVLRFCFHCGTTLTGVAGFQAANILAGPGQALGLSTATACYLTNVGLYLDPNNTGIAPPWQMPDEAQELAACQRYWQGYSLAIVPSTPTPQSFIFPVRLRTVPAVSGGGAGFATGGPTVQSVQMWQTSAAAQAIVVNARM